MLNGAAAAAAMQWCNGKCNAMHGANGKTAARCNGGGQMLMLSMHKCGAMVQNGEMQQMTAMQPIGGSSISCKCGSSKWCNQRQMVQQR